MMRYSLTTAAAVAALTFGLVDPKLVPREAATPQSYMVIAADDTANDDAESAKMDKATGTDTDGADTSETETKKVDQPDREANDMNGAAPQ
jgi:hypothetical protein